MWTDVFDIQGDFIKEKIELVRGTGRHKEYSTPILRSRIWALERPADASKWRLDLYGSHALGLPFAHKSPRDIAAVHLLHIDMSDNPK